MLKLFSLLLMTGCLRTTDGVCEPEFGVSVVCSYEDKPRVTDPWPPPTILDLCDVTAENAYRKLLNACLATGWTCRISCTQTAVTPEICILPEEESIIDETP